MLNCKRGIATYKILTKKINITTWYNDFEKRDILEPYCFSTLKISSLRRISRTLKHRCLHNRKITLNRISSLLCNDGLWEETKTFNKTGVNLKWENIKMTETKR